VKSYHIHGDLFITLRPSWGAWVHHGGALRGREGAWTGGRGSELGAGGARCGRDVQTRQVGIRSGRPQEATGRVVSQISYRTCGRPERMPTCRVWTTRPVASCQTTRPVASCYKNSIIWDEIDFI